MAETKLLEQELDNRMVLGLYDQSRRVAGDRWAIRLHGEVRISMEEEEGPADFSSCFLDNDRQSSSC